jgi:hypothetical protein
MLEKFRMFGSQVFVNELGRFEELAAILASILVGFFFLDQRSGYLVDFTGEFIA